jgi:Putative metal-binding motif
MRRLFAIAALVAAGCFQPWTVAGPYLCGGGCPDDMTCDDGVCCFPNTSPICPALVLDGGTCFSGATPKAYFQDFDEDGYGNPNASKLYCSRPVSDKYVEDNTDCNDNAATAHPRGQETCDGLDNDCNGQIDEGLTPQKTFYRDQDDDGAGDPTKPLIACGKPTGYVENNSDCGPDQPFRYPGANELCNVLDDDCDNITDEAPIDVGTPCFDGGFGVCGPGTIACGPGGSVCVPNTPPSADLCDGEDNNCNGQVDEQPECGGPSSLLGPGVNIGAQNLQAAVPFSDQTTRCLKSWDGGTVAPTGDSWAPPTWAGASSNSHVWFAEAPGNRTWDLSKAGAYLHLNFAYTQLNGDPAGAWNDSRQPVIYLCDATGTQLNRYVPQASTSGLMGGVNGSISSDMPIAGGNGWTVGIGSGFDIKRVKRIEVYVKPDYYLMTSGPSFTMTFRSDAGFYIP